jgi:hypothetical protein
MSAEAGHNFGVCGSRLRALDRDAKRTEHQPCVYANL